MIERAGVKEGSIVPKQLLDRMTNSNTWKQAIAEAELQISRLRESIRYFRKQERDGVDYPCVVNAKLANHRKANNRCQKNCFLPASR